MASGCEFVLFSFQLVLSDQMYSGIGLENISKLSCAAICAGQGSCTSFVYKRYERNCFMLDFNITDRHRMTSTKGMRHYRKISSGLQSPSAAAVRASTEDHGDKQRRVSGGLQSPSIAILRDSTADHDGNQRGVFGTRCPSKHVIPYIYHAKGNFCYQDWTTGTMVWKDAKLACGRAGGMLMKADTLEKHLLFVSFAKNNPNIKTLWVGGWSSGLYKEKWRWVDGTPVVNDYWQEEGADQWPANNCLSYAWSKNEFKWDDVICITFKGFFCEAHVKGQHRKV